MILFQLVAYIRKQLNRLIKNLQRIERDLSTSVREKLTSAINAAEAGIDINLSKSKDKEAAVLARLEESFKKEQLKIIADGEEKIMSAVAKLQKVESMMEKM